MQIEPQISFRGIDRSPAVEEAIRRRIERLEQVHDRITSCHVVVEAPHRHGRKGKIYHVRVDLRVPGSTIFVGRDSEVNHAHEDVYVAVRDSFDAAQRRLEDVARKMSGHLTKRHPEKVRGTVARLDAEEGFGFIATADGREVFFRRENLASEDQWRALTVGADVHFTEHEGEQGPHASAVSVL